MSTIILDLRTSQNSTTVNSPLLTVPVTPTTGAMFGTIGLIIGAVTTARVDLNATIGLEPGTTVPATARITIVRNPTVPTSPAGGTVILVADHELTAANATKLITVDATDVNAKASDLTPNQVNYSIFAQNITDVPFTTITRTGPESLSGIAATG
jgi:hypothetical protein